MGNLLNRSLTYCKKLIKHMRTQKDDHHRNTSMIIDQLSRLPPELVVDIVSKQDIATIMSSNILTSYLSQIRTYSTYLPYSIFDVAIHKIISCKTALMIYKYVGYPILAFSCCILLCFILVVITRIILLPLALGVTWLMSGLFTFSCLILTILSFYLFKRYYLHAIRRGLRFLGDVLIPLGIRFIRYVLSYRIVSVPLRHLQNVAVALVIVFLFVLVVPLLSPSGWRSFQRLSNLEYLEITFPTLLFDHPTLWMRGDFHSVGKKKRYYCFVLGNIIEHGQSEQRTIVDSWETLLMVIRLPIVAVLYFLTYASFVLNLPSHLGIVSGTISKKGGKNLTLRLFFEPTGPPDTENKSFLGVVKMKLLQLFTKDDLRDGELQSVTRQMQVKFSVDSESLKIKDAWVSIYCDDEDNDGTRSGDELIRDYLSTEKDEEECENIERKEIMEAVRKILE